MPKNEPSASKQRKGRIPETRDARRAARQPDPVPAKTVNERQIATGTLATTGDTGADLVARVSDWLQANGKFVVGVLSVVVVAILATLWFARSTAGQENRYQAMIAKASSESKAKDMIAEFDKIAGEAGDDPVNLAEWNYRLVSGLYAILDNESRNGRKIEDDYLKRVNDAAAAYETHHASDPASAERLPRVRAMKARLGSFQDFITGAASRALSDSEYKPTRAEPKIIGDDEYPVVAFETTQGTARFRLFDDAPLRNSIGLIVTLVERGYYQGISTSLYKAPGIGKLDDPVFSGTRMIGWGQSGKLVELPKEEDKDKKLTDEEKKEAARKKNTQPFFTIEPEASSAHRNTAGTLILYYEASQPFKRGTHLAVNLQDHPQFDGKYTVVGEVADKESLDVLGRMNRQDKILDAWMESKRKRDYTPAVIFTQGPNAGGVPTLWLDGTSKVEPPRIAKKDPVIDDNANPLIVISTDQGDVEVELDEDTCPNTVANIIYLIEKDGYKGSIFHRVEGVGQSPDAAGARIIQGGRDPENVKKAKELRDKATDLKDRAKRASTGEAQKLEDEARSLESEASTLDEKFGWTIKNEAAEEYRPKYNLRNTTGTIAMARTSGLDTAGRQFFINLKDFPDWDKKDSPYCVFGRVTRNLWAMHNIRKDDKLIEAWVVRKRSHKYIPTVKKEGDTSFLPVEKTE